MNGAVGGAEQREDLDQIELLVRRPADEAAILAEAGADGAAETSFRLREPLGAALKGEG